MTRAARDLVELLDHLEAAAATIRRHGPAILDRAAIPSGRDGYPARSSGAQVSSAPQVRHECWVAYDASGLYQAKCHGCEFVGPWWPERASAVESATQHEDQAGSALDYSDPTGEAAVSRSEPDPVRALAKRTTREVLHAVRALTAVANALADEAGKGAALNDPTDWCSHHLRFGMHEPRRVVHDKATGKDRPAGDLCKWCLDFKTAQNVLPPKELVEMRARGRSVREADVTRALRRAG